MKKKESFDNTDEIDTDYIEGSDDSFEKDLADQDPVEEGIYSLFPYFGGKNKLCRNIYALTPPDVRVHVEPFCGAATVSFNKTTQHEVMIINDKDPFLYNCLNVIKDEKTFPEFKRRVDRIGYNRDDFWYYADVYVKNKRKLHTYRFEKPHVDAALLFFTIISQGYGAKLDAGFAGMTGGRKEAWFARKERLQTYHNKLQTIKICNLSFSELINDCSNKYGKDVFFYCDPPYSASERVKRAIRKNLSQDGLSEDMFLDEYAFEMNDGHHALLLSILLKQQEKNGIRFLLSNYGSKKNVWYNKLLRYCNRIELKTVTDTGPCDEEGKRKLRIEVMWSNYKVGKAIRGLPRLIDFNFALHEEKKFFNSPEWKAHEDELAYYGGDYNVMYADAEYEPPYYPTEEEIKIMDERWEKNKDNLPTYVECFDKDLPR